MEFYYIFSYLGVILGLCFLADFAYHKEREMSFSDLKAHTGWTASEVEELKRICFNKCEENNGHLFYRGVDTGKYSQTSFKLRNTHFHLNKAQLSLFLKLIDSGFDMNEWDERLQTSHLCHKKACLKAEHLSLETSEQNRERDECKRQNRCTGHKDLPNCLL